MTLEISPRQLHHRTRHPPAPGQVELRSLLPSSYLALVYCGPCATFGSITSENWSQDDLRTVADRKLQIYFQSTGNPACGSEWMMGDIKQHAACCCTALGVNVANFMLSSFYNCNVANMFERAGVRSCVGTFSSSIHVLSMAQSAKYTLHLLLLQCSVIFCTVEHLHGVRNTKPEWLHVAK